MITLITGDANELKEAQALLGNVALKSQDLDVSLEARSYAQLSGNEAKMAAILCNGPVIVETAGLSFEAFGPELPGSAAHLYLEQLGPDGLARMLQGFENKGAVAVCTVAFSKGANKSTVFHGRVRGRIVAPRGPQTSGWDSIFEPEGSSKTLAEMDKTEKDKFSARARAYGALKEFMNSS